MSLKFWLLCGGVTLDGTETIQFKENGGATRTGTLAAGTYYLSGTGGSDDLATAIKTAMEGAIGATLTYTITYNGWIATDFRNCVLTIEPSATTVQILGASSFDLTTIGFPQSDTADSATLAASLSSTVSWCSDQPATELEPAEDKSMVFQTMTPSGKTHNAIIGDDQEMRMLTMELVNGDRTWTQLATDASDAARAFQGWRRLAKDGRPIQLYALTESADVLTTATSADLTGTYVLFGPIVNRLPMVRHPGATNGFDFEIGLHPYVS